MTGGELSGNLADEGAAMRKGRTGPIVALVVVAVAALVGVFVLIGGDDDQRVHRELGRKINGLKLDGFDRFWACALVGTDFKRVKSNADLRHEVSRRVEEAGLEYAAHVRDTCLPALENVAPDLDVLIVHDPELKVEVAAMSEAASDLRMHWNALITYMVRMGDDFDLDVVDGHASKISRSWYEFRKAYAQANQLLKQHLG